jgi:hypothetical protein
MELSGACRSGAEGEGEISGDEKSTDPGLSVAERKRSGISPLERFARRLNYLAIDDQSAQFVGAPRRLSR